jgi:hypothetical protein
MVERNGERARRDEPIRRTRVASPLVVLLEHSVLNVDTADAQEFSLDERMVGPGNKGGSAGER